MSPKPKRQTAQTKQIVKANVLVEASYRLTLGEQQILLLAIATLGGLKEVDATTRFTVSAQDLVDTLGDSAQTEKNSHSRPSMYTSAIRWH
jgi:hypothetical protein